MKRNHLPVLLHSIFLLLLAVAAGCAPLTPPPPPPTRTPTPLPPTATATSTPTATPRPTATPTPVSLHLILVQDLPPVQARALAEEAAAFATGHPGVTIEVRARAEDGRPWHLALGDAALMAAYVAESYRIEPATVELAIQDTGLKPQPAEVSVA